MDKNMNFQEMNEFDMENYVGGMILLPVIDTTEFLLGLIDGLRGK
jgi:hypothetical protein